MDKIALSIYFYIPFICFLSVCHRGYFNCSYSPCPAVCTVYSDRHYHTFDGLEYDYHSDCQVYLLKVSAVWLSMVFQIRAKFWDPAPCDRLCARGGMCLEA